MRVKKVAKGFLLHINNLLKESDLIIQVLDARRPNETRNFDLEKKTRGKKKELIFVINKSDLVNDKKELEKIKKEIQLTTPSRVVFVSALKKDGINLIRREISITQSKLKTKELNIGIIGYPNVGKSTLINSLAGKGRGRVATSRKAGLTRGVSKIKITEGVYLLDSPGIIPFKEDEFNLFLVESKNPNQLKNPEIVAIKLINYLGKEKIARAYEIDLKEIEKVDENDLIELIAKKKNLIQKGGKPDYNKGVRNLLEKYQKHELN